MTASTGGRFLVWALTIGLWVSLAAPVLHGQSAPQPEAARQPEAVKEYVLSPGDTIAVKFAYNPELSEQLPIRPDGRIALQIIGDVTAAGLSVSQLRSQLIERYTGALKHPELVVIVNSFGMQKVYVGGEVARPGEIPLSSGMTTLQAIIMAGGDRRTASTRNVVIVRDQGTDTPLFLLVDLKKVLSQVDMSADVRLQPRDIIFVPMSKIAKVNNFVQMYIRDVVPMSMVLGLYYNFNPFLPQ